MNLQLYQEMAFDTPIGKQAKSWLELHWHEWLEAIGNESLAKKIVVEMVWGFGFKGWKSGQSACEEWNGSSEARAGVAGVRQRSQPPDTPNCSDSGKGMQERRSASRGGTVMTDIGPVPREFVMFDNFMQQCMLDISRQL